MELVKITAQMTGIGLFFSRSTWGWIIFLFEGMGAIGHFFCRSNGQDWLILLQECCDWSLFPAEVTGISKSFAVEGRTG